MIPRPTMTAAAVKSGWLTRLESSIERNKAVRESAYYQIATIGKDCRPHNRTVVHRALWEDGRLVFVTDSRSQKVEDVRSVSRNAEIAWYLPATREQYRIFGQLSIHGPDCPDPAMQEARRAAWARMSDPGRTQFFWPPPRQPRTAVDLGAGSDVRGVELQAERSEGHPPLTFSLAVVYPEEVDRVDLEANTRTVWTRTADEVWSEEEINP